MKNLKVVLLAALAITGLASCAKECETHTDKNHDGTCEVCGKTGLAVNHVDITPKDHKCDVCGKELSKCEDTNKDHKCDYCGAELSKCVDESPKDHKCDTCGAVLSTCTDLNHDAYCDICGKSGMEVHHKDEDKNDKCDVCGCDIICESFKLDVSGAKTEFEKDSVFSSSGVKVLGTYTDETEREIAFETSTPDMTTVGTKEVTVTFIINGVSKTLTYEIEVSYWSEDALDIFDYVSLFSVVGGFPYMVGMDVEYTVEEGYLTSWRLVKEGAVASDVRAYWEIVKYFSKTKSMQYSATENVDVTFAPVEANVEEFESEEGELAKAYGIQADTLRLFKLVPTFLHGKYYYRAFTQDEYFLFGLDEETGNLVGYNKLIENTFDSYFGGDDDVIGSYWPKEYTEMIFEEINNVFYYYYSEPAAAALPQAEVADGYAMLTSFKSAYPFDEDMDDWNVAFRADCLNGTAAEEAALRSALTSAGFVQSPGKDNIYTLSDKFIGEVTYVLIPYDDNYCQKYYGQVIPGAESEELDAAFGYVVYYSAPDYFAYANDPALNAAALAVADGLALAFTESEIVEEFGWDVTEQIGYNYDFVSVSADKAGNPADYAAVTLSVIDSMPDEFVFVNSESDTYGTQKYNSLLFTNSEIDITVEVYEAGTSGEVEIYFTAEETFNFSKYVVDAFLNYLQIDAVSKQYALAPLTDSYYTFGIIKSADGSDLQAVATAFNANYADTFFRDTAAVTAVPGGGGYQATYDLEGYAEVTMLYSYISASKLIACQIECISQTDALVEMYNLQATFNVLFGIPSLGIDRISLSEYSFNTDLVALELISESAQASAFAKLQYIISALKYYGVIKDPGSYTGTTSDCYVSCLSPDGLVDIEFNVFEQDGYFKMQITTKTHEPEDPKTLGQQFADIFSATALPRDPDGSYCFSGSSSSSAYDLAVGHPSPDFVHYVGTNGSMDDLVQYYTADNGAVVVELHFVNIYAYNEDTSITDQETLDDAIELGTCYTKNSETEEYELVTPGATYDSSTTYYVEDFVECDIEIVSYYENDGSMTPGFFLDFVNDVVFSGLLTITYDADKGIASSDSVSLGTGDKSDCQAKAQAFVDALDTYGVSILDTYSAKVVETEDGYTAVIYNNDGSVVVIYNVTVDGEGNISGQLISGYTSGE